MFNDNKNGNWNNNQDGMNEEVKSEVREPHIVSEMKAEDAIIHESEKSIEEQNIEEQNIEEQNIEEQETQQQRFEQSNFEQQHGQNHEGHYQNQSWGQIYEGSSKAKKKSKKKGMQSKIAGITAAALLFGSVSGATMAGVNAIGSQFFNNSSTQVEQTQTRSTLAVVQPEENTSMTDQDGVMDVSSIAEAAMPSVVAITSTMYYTQNTWFDQGQTVEIPSSGSGIIIGQNETELLIVTNNHVVQDSDSLSVAFIDEEVVTAAIKGLDSQNDLAVIAVPLDQISESTMSQIKIASIGNSDDIKVGEGVVAIGNALGYGQSVTVGYISAKNREVTSEDQTVTELLQTDAAINPGNSGGALLNMQGEVIGINVAKYSSTDVEGMGYAIPISKAEGIINDLMNAKTKIELAEEKQGYLGIQGQNIDSQMAQSFGMPEGIYVFKIVEGFAAAESDLREKDVITKFDNQPVRSMTELQNILTYYEGGSTVTLTVQSLENGNYVERQVEVTLGYRPVNETN